MIEVAGLEKTYGGFAAVVDSTFSVEEGEVFGIVGPNGAGKTTTLKVLAGLIEPTSGEARVAGYDSTESAMRHHLGFLPEESPLYEEMTATSYLRFFADLYEVPRSVADERIERALDRLDLDHRDRRLGDVSKGMKRKVAIARSLVNDPDVLVYDEPASGLDPVTTNSVLEFTRELRAAGKTVVFSAHNLYHVESVCDRVAVMNEGRIVARGTVDGIRERHGETTYHVYTDVPPEAGAAEDGADAEGNGTDPEAFGGTEEVGDRYRTVVPSMDAVERVRTAASEAGGTVVDIRTREPSLEDVFLDLVGRPMPGRRGGAGIDEGDGTPGIDEGDAVGGAAAADAGGDADTSEAGRRDHDDEREERAGAATSEEA
ncbi:ABC-2 type transport system ATP-binding protein [Halorubrum aquaticum]|uniref:ABC-2 type transport system ATP-binding protein n=1 Tax=Halorubrum aquaticum TaxID=387340 RepID=A0A1I2Z072_9EURY|nr:ABC transporter ATP-binding protein [Halorubrum aquaticum]SFH31288.1 ABC-2 type transport system ATP-binding protein [Halorubrum aquaticum]